MISSSPTRERRACLTPLGEVVALGIRLREATRELDELDARRLALALRDLVDRYCPSTPRSIA
jgi:hypothetical protein